MFIGILYCKTIKTYDLLCMYISLVFPPVICLFVTVNIFKNCTAVIAYLNTRLMYDLLRDAWVNRTALIIQFESFCIKHDQVI